MHFCTNCVWVSPRERWTAPCSDFVCRLSAPVVELMEAWTVAKELFELALEMVWIAERDMAVLLQQNDGGARAWIQQEESLLSSDTNAVIAQLHVMMCMLQPTRTTFLAPSAANLPSRISAANYGFKAMAS